MHSTPGSLARHASRALLAALFALAPVSLASTQSSVAGKGAPPPAVPSPASERVGRSPWGAADEIGTLNMMTPASRTAILSRIDGGRAYDLSVEYYNGMPSWSALGDPTFQMWNTHTPRGHAVDDPMKLGAQQNALVSYTGDALSMYTHTGTHIDTLNHFGLHGEIYNGFKADEHLGDQGWHKGGAEKFPPIISRGVLIDVASAKGVGVLPPSYQITPDDLTAALAKQGTKLERGDTVFIRTGKMTLFHDADAYLANPPGLSLAGAKWLVEKQGAMVIG
ncbi:MAG TPA: cyclase family protein, partial [Gemmatimonadaceae bacterium]|nr:cyclase family protein [Gemmatimonadaceae bacterium]